MAVNFGSVFPLVLGFYFAGTEGGNRIGRIRGSNLGTNAVDQSKRSDGVLQLRREPVAFSPN